jgi:twitching motility protein PilT
MQTLDDAIMDVLNKGMISPEDAYSRSIDKTKFRAMLKNPPEEWQ